jgi:hypothetical protein
MLSGVQPGAEEAMKRAAYSVSLVMTAVLLLAAVPSEAGGHGRRGHGRHGDGWHGRGWHGYRGHGYYPGARVVIGLGSAFWWGSRSAWYGPPPAYAYAPRVIVEERPVYIQREPPPSYWYYCESAGAYYPSVPACPEPWVKVPPRLE